MPIDANLLKRIEANDETLERLDFSHQILDNLDIEKLANALPVADLINRKIYTLCTSC
jgi:hypothetical protein